MPDRRSLPILALMALLVVVLALLVPFLMEMAQLGGRYIPTDNLQADYAIGLGWAALLGMSIAFWPVPQAHRGALLRLWGVKCLVTLGAMLFSEWYYQADAFDYFRNARDGVFTWADFAWGAGSQDLTLLVGLQQVVLPSFHAAKVTFSMLGLVAVYHVYLATRLYTKRESLSPFYIMGLFPSVLFWSSILGKDPLVLLGIAAYMFGVAQCHTGRNLSGLPALLIGVLLASLIRPWLAAILLAPLIVFAAFGLRTVRARLLVLVMAIAIMPLTFAGTSRRLGFSERDDTVHSIEKQNAAYDHGGSTNQLATTDGSVASVVALAPLGMLSILFRPLPGEVNNVFGAVAGLENTVLIVLFVRAVWRTPAREMRDPFLLWAILLLLVWLAGYGIVAAANLGSSARYRLQIMPLFVWLLVHLSRKRPAEQVQLVRSRLLGDRSRWSPERPQPHSSQLVVAGSRVPGVLGRSGGSS